MSGTDRQKATWDLFMAARVSDINRALAKSVQISTFDPPKGDYGDRIAAKIESWKIVDQLPDFHVDDSIRSNVIFELTLKDLTLSGGLLLSEGQVITLPKVRAYISMGLKFVREHEDSVTHHLVMDPPPPPDASGHFEQFSWAVNKADFTTDESKSGIAPLQVALGQWAAAHWADLAHVFATLDVFESGGPAAPSWLHPTAVDFAYAAAQDPNDSVLCVLAMTGGRAPDHNRDIVLPTALPDGAAAFVHIDRDIYLANGIMPGFSTLPGPSAPAQLQYTSETGRITLAQPVPLPTQNIGHNAEKLTADFPCPSEISSIQVEILKDAILCQFETRLTVRERHATTFTNAHAGITRTLYDDRDLGYVFCRQDRYFVASAVADDDGRPHVKIDSDKTRAADKKWTQQAPKSTAEIINDYLQMGAEALTALLIPPLGVAELLLTAGLNTAIQLANKDELNRDKSFENGVSVPDLLTAINAQWGGFQQLSAIKASIDDGLSIIGSLNLSD